MLFQSIMLPEACYAPILLDGVTKMHINLRSAHELAKQHECMKSVTAKELKVIFGDSRH